MRKSIFKERADIQRNEECGMYILTFLKIISSPASLLSLFWKQCGFYISWFLHYSIWLLKSDSLSDPTIHLFSRVWKLFRFQISSPASLHSLSWKQCRFYISGFLHYFNLVAYERFSFSPNIPPVFQGLETVQVSDKFSCFITFSLLETVQVLHNWVPPLLQFGCFISTILFQTQHYCSGFR